MKHKGFNFVPVKLQHLNPPLSFIDLNIFTTHFPTNCMENGCKDNCCSAGCRVDMKEVQTIYGYRHIIEKYTGDIYLFGKAKLNTNHPSGIYQRTLINHGKCVFRSTPERGCLLHKISEENSMDYHILKPRICALFPVWIHNGCLFVEHLWFPKMPCYDKGDNTVYPVIKNELHYYYGDDLINTLEELAGNGK